MTTTATTAPAAGLLRRGPYVLLVLALGITALSSKEFGITAGLPLIGAAGVVIAVMHYLVVDRRWDSGVLDDRLGQGYIVVRTALAFVLTWLNPFFAVFAVCGYFDAHLYLRRRRTVVVLLVTAVTMAGSQSGGLPLRSGLQAAAFVALYVLNAGLVVMFSRISRQEQSLAEERDSTIAQLERANAALERALAENAVLHGRLVEQARRRGIQDERERLALEIHDTIAQGLTGVVTQLQAGEDAADPVAARGHRDRAALLAREALGEARRSVQGLLPAQLADAGLDQALERLVREWSRSTGIAGELTVTGTPEPQHPDVDATVLRVVQESLTNVAKHSGAGRVGVTLSYTDDELVLDVRDDGVGFDQAGVGPARVGPAGVGPAGVGPAGVGPLPRSPDAARATGGVGLHGMRQRADRLAGELVVESEPGGGTAVSLRVPTAVRHG